MGEFGICRALAFRVRLNFDSRQDFVFFQSRGHHPLKESAGI